MGSGLAGSQREWVPGQSSDLLLAMCPFLRYLFLILLAYRAVFLNIRPTKRLQEVDNYVHKSVI
ncbi:MAG: hypothetical protein DRO87_06255 [Candidatus Thorarchaeota archaeon]|nr:MAG: hypothetical protein DRP09_12005 [Candidatus Thorarchaeota archaeon]RLI58089.1 MAG: hypothetical protein DRO87_06255 [Candidatus Thorarchaeota archaeon]